MGRAYRQGSSIVWDKNGGSGKYDITLASLATTKARQGEGGDLGVHFAKRYLVTCTFALDTPADDETVDLYWAPSADGTTYAGGASGDDGAYQNTNEAAHVEQLIEIGNMDLCASDTTALQTVSFIWTNPTRYGAPVVDNNSTKGFTSVTTHKITFTPLHEVDP